MIRPPESDDQQAFAVALVALLEALAVPYAIGGSVAAMEYGEPRLTIDIDLMLQAAPADLAAFVAAVEGWELYVTPLEVILESDIPNGLPFNVIDGAAGTRADLYVVEHVGFPGSAMARRQRRLWQRSTGTEAWFLSPEDVILYKLIYYRRGGEVAAKHPTDIARMLAVVGQQIDQEYMVRWAGDLGVLDLWQAISSDTEAGSPRR